MRFLPLFRYNKRARSTSWAIALCTMFIVASFSVAAGLRSSMDTLADNFESEFSLVMHPSDDGWRSFEAEDISAIMGQSALGLLTTATVQPGDTEVTIFSVTDAEGILPESITASGSSVKIGGELSISGDITVTALRTSDATVSGEFSSAIFSPRWMLASDEFVREVMDEDYGSYSFAIVKDISETQAAELRSDGLSVQPFIAIIDFLDDSVTELENDAYWVLAPSAFVIAVLAHSFMGSEISDRRHDIGIIKTLGAGRRRILLYLIGESTIICAWGGALGLALGIVLSYAVSTVGSHVFTSVFVIDVQESLLLLAYIVTVLAGICGSLIPAMRMLMSSPAGDIREVA